MKHFYALFSSIHSSVLRNSCKWPCFWIFFIVITWAYLPLSIAQNGIPQPTKSEYNRVASTLELEEFVRKSECGLNFVAVSTKLTNRYAPITALNPTMTVSGINSVNGIEVVAAYLYWVVEGGKSPGRNLITLKTPTSEASLIGEEIGIQNKGKCWGCESAKHYRAEVTSFICPTNPNGNYKVSDYPSTFFRCPTPGVCICQDGDTDGATLIIIYKDYSANYKGTLILLDGLQYSQGGEHLTNTFDNLRLCNAPRGAKVLTVLSDYQKNTIFQGRDYIMANNIRHDITPNFYNQELFNIAISPNITQLSAKTWVSQDCYTIMLQALYYQNDNCTPACVPNPNPPLATTGELPSLAFCKGNLPPPLTLTNFTGEILKWQKSDCTGNWADLEDTTPTYQPPVLYSKTCYRALVQSNNCILYSPVATLTTADQISGGTLEGDKLNCGFSNPITLTLHDYSGKIIYWETSSAPNCQNGSGTWNKINTTLDTYIINTLSQTSCFRTVVKQGSCKESYSNIATVEVYGSPIAGTITGTKVVCASNPVAQLQLNDYMGRVLFWEQSNTCDPQGSWNRINVTTNTFQPVINDRTCFRAVVRISSCPHERSAVFEVKALAETQPGTLSRNTTVCGANNQINLKLSDAQGDIIRWEYSTDNFATVQTLNHTASHLELQNITQTVQYRVVVQAGICPPQTTNSVKITYLTGFNAGILTGSQTVCSGMPVQTVRLSGYSGTITRWEYLDAQNNWQVLNEAGTSALFLPQNITQSTQFRVVLGGGDCPQVFSNTVNFVYQNGSQGGKLSSGQTVCGVLAEALLELSEYSGQILQWERSGNGTDWQIINHTDPRLLLNDITSTFFFRVKVQNSDCPPLYSNTIELRVAPEPIAGKLPKDTVICAINPNYKIELKGYRGTHFRWMQSFDGINWQNIGSNSPEFKPKNIEYTAYYYVEVSSPACDYVVSDTFQLTIASPTVAGIVSKDTTLCAKEHKYSFRLQNYQGQILYWQIQAFHSDEWTIIAETNPLLTRNFTQTTKVRAVVQNNGCNIETSANAIITLLPPTEVGSISGGGTFCLGSKTNTMELNDVKGMVLRWEISKDKGNNWISIGKAGLLKYHPGKLTVTTWFRAIIQNSPCGALATDPVVYTISPQTVAGILSKDQSICTGQKAILQLMNYRGNILYWEKSVDNGVNWIKVNQTSPRYEFTPSEALALYRVVVQSNGCAVLTSNTVKVNVFAEAKGGTILRDRYICFGGTSGKLELINYAGQITHWESSVNGITWKRENNTLAFFESQAIYKTMYFRACVRNGICSQSYSSVATIRLVDELLGGYIEGDSVYCIGSGAIALNLVGNYGVPIRWEYSYDDWATLQSEDHPFDSYLLPPIHAEIRIRVVSGSGICNSVYSKEWKISPKNPPVLQLQTTRGCNNTGDIIAQATNGTPPYTFYLSQNPLIANSTGRFTGIPIDNYIFKVKDALGCEDIQPVVFPSEIQLPDIFDISYTTPSQIMVQWNASPGDQTLYKLWYRINGEMNWSSFEPQAQTYRMVTNLQHSTEYEFKVDAYCNGDTLHSQNSAFQFTKSYPGCASRNPIFPGSIYVNSITPNSAYVFWSSVADVLPFGGYIISYGLKSQNPNTWSQFVVCAPDTQFLMQNLNPLSVYALRIRTNCSNCTTALKNSDKRSNWSDIYSFQTVNQRNEGLEVLHSPYLLNTCFSIYPNPNSGNFTLQFSNDGFDELNQPVKMQIYDALGRCMWQEEIFKNKDMNHPLNQTFDFENWGTGIYTLQIQWNDKFQLIRWVKN